MKVTNLLQRDWFISKLNIDLALKSQIMFETNVTTTIKYELLLTAQLATERNHVKTTYHC